MTAIEAVCGEAKKLAEAETVPPFIVVLIVLGVLVVAGFMGPLPGRGAAGTGVGGRGGERGEGAEAVTAIEAVCGEAKKLAEAETVPPFIVVLIVLGVLVVAGFIALAAFNVGAESKRDDCAVCPSRGSKFCVDGLCVPHCDVHHKAVCYRSKLPDAGGKERAA